MMHNKKPSKKRVVLVLWFALGTSVVLADPGPFQSGNAVDSKVFVGGSTSRQSESGRSASSYPETVFGEDEENISPDTNEDENLEGEIFPPVTQFKDKKKETITDFSTGLMWTQNANLLGDTITLREALDYIERMNAGEYPNFGYTNWRLPSVSEFQTLIDYRRYATIGHVLLYKGHPFQNVQLLKFNDRSLPTYLTTSEYLWFKLFYCSLVGRNFNACFGYLWPVRDVK